MSLPAYIQRGECLSAVAEFGNIIRRLDRRIRDVRKDADLMQKLLDRMELQYGNLRERVAMLEGRMKGRNDD